MPKIAAIVEELAAFKDVAGCALVETSTGMVWHFAGQLPDLERIAEAAVEFWRIQQRLSSQLVALGALRSVACSFSNRVVALFPCCEEPSLVLVCIAAKGHIAWDEWSVKVAHLRQALAAQRSAAAYRSPQKTG